MVANRYDAPEVLHFKCTFTPIAAYVTDEYPRKSARLFEASAVVILAPDELEYPLQKLLWHSTNKADRFALINKFGFGTGDMESRNK